MNQPETIRTILEKTKTIAVVGLSDNPDRPAFHVSRYMQQEGYRIIPVHPRAPRLLGRRPTRPSMPPMPQRDESTWWTYFALPNTSRRLSKT